MAIVSPLVAEMDIPVPMETFAVASLAGLVLSLFISTSSDEDQKVSRITMSRATSKSGHSNSRPKS